MGGKLIIGPWRLELVRVQIHADPKTCVDRLLRLRFGRERKWRTEPALWRWFGPCFICHVQMSLSVVSENVAIQTDSDRRIMGDNLLLIPLVRRWGRGR